MRRLADARVPFTVCPNANVRINPDVCPSLAEHPFPAMRAAGLLVTLNTDDPALTNLDLTEEFAASAAAVGYGWDDVVAIALDAVDASWLDDTERAPLRAAISRAASA